MYELASTKPKKLDGVPFKHNMLFVWVPVDHSHFMSLYVTS